MHHEAVTQAPLLCVRCGVPVERNAEQYESFERMHWVCFHYEFEHHGRSPDPDVACQDPGCPARAFDQQAQPSWEELHG